MVNFNIHGSTSMASMAHVSCVEASAALPSVPGLEDSKPLPVTAKKFQGLIYRHDMIS